MPTCCSPQTMIRLQRSTDDNMNVTMEPILAPLPFTPAVKDVYASAEWLGAEDEANLRPGSSFRSRAVQNQLLQTYEPERRVVLAAAIYALLPVPQKDIATLAKPHCKTLAHFGKPGNRLTTADDDLSHHRGSLRTTATAIA